MELLPAVFTMGPSEIPIIPIYQCRGDSYLSKCRACFLFAIVELRKRCPKNKGGIIWFDQCFVEISKILVWTANEEEKFDHANDFSLHNPNKVSCDTKFFNKDTMAFLEQLTLKANNKGNKDKNGEMTMYAAGKKSLGTKKLYAMVQCTKYIYVSAKMCKKCLNTIIKEFPKCCGDKQGGRILGTSCNFRYELYPFLKI